MNISTNQALNVRTAERLERIREKLKEKRLSAWIQPMNDSFFNEWLPESEQRILWVSGFTGSAGTLIITNESAVLFVDSRYPQQASEQVDTDKINVMADTEIKNWIASPAHKGQKFGFDPMQYAEAGLAILQEAASEASFALVPEDENIIDLVWQGRPDAPLDPIWRLEEIYAGETVVSKRTRLKQKLKKLSVDAIFISRVDTVCWLLNIRGSDISRTPVAIARALFHSDGSLDLFIDPQKVPNEGLSHVGNDVRISPDNNLLPVLQKLGQQKARVLFDVRRSPVKLAECLANAGGEVIKENDPAAAMQSLKNETELSGARASQIRDGVALTKFIYWLTNTATIGEVDEYSAAKMLESLRAKEEKFIDLSFDALSAAGPNAAMNHYVPLKKSARKLISGEMYLIDSGGQYLDGTTDTTRTIAIGTPKTTERDAFTYVLKSHIALATALFPKGTNGRVMDAITRAPMWRAGLNYGHGTGHGVGSCLSVHEFPPTISPLSNDMEFEPGMLITNEPGYYVENGYGIRIENVMAVVETSKENAGVPFYGFETITRAPIDHNLINQELLTGEEISWINSYHKKVWMDLSPRFEKDELNWLRKATKAIGNEAQ